MKFLKFTIYNYMIIFLSIMGIFGFLKFGIEIIPNFIIAISSCVLADGTFEFIKNKKFSITPSAIISGLIIAEVLSTNNLIYLFIASVIAISSKHFINFENRHVINPANLGLFAVMLIFTNENSWWASSLGSPYHFVLIIFGIFLAYKMRNYLMIIAFLIAHSAIAVIYSFFTSQPMLGYVLSINLYFMFFMLVEPITSPKSPNGKILYGILVALVSFIILLVAPQYDHFISGLVIVDIFVPLINRIYRK